MIFAAFIGELLFSAIITFGLKEFVSFVFLRTMFRVGFVFISKKILVLTFVVFSTEVI